MYEKVNKLSETHFQVLGLYTRGYDKEYYVREVKKLLNISPRTAQLALEFLEKKTVLESAIKGRIKMYKIKKSFIAKEYFMLAEMYKKTQFLKLPNPKGWGFPDRIISLA